MEGMKVEAERLPLPSFSLPAFHPCIPAILPSAFLPCHCQLILPCPCQLRSDQ
jgi:hypothetical protein